MSYLGSFSIDDLLTFVAQSCDPATGEDIDTDAVPDYRVYEDETGSPLLTGSMAKLDDSNTIGFYSEQITLSAANGFETGKCYTVRKTAAVDGVSASSFDTFQVGGGSSGPTAAQIADAVWDEDATGHQTGGTFGQAIGDPAADTHTIYGAVVTNATGVDIATDIVAMKVDTAAILVDTGTTLDGRIPAALVSGRMDSSVGAMAANVITATAINADAITDAKVAADVTIASVTGAVGSVTGAVGSVTGNVSGNLVGTIGGMTVAAIKDFFDTDSTTTYGAAVAGSVVKEIADNAGGSSLTVNDIVNGILAGIIEGTITLQEAQRLQLAAAAGKLSGAATATITIKDTTDTKNRIVATVDADGNRTAMTYDVS